jgi:hypothetical protein
MGLLDWIKKDLQSGVPSAPNESLSEVLKRAVGLGSRDDRAARMDHTDPDAPASAAVSGGSPPSQGRRRWVAFLVVGLAGLLVGAAAGSGGGGDTETVTETLASTTTVTKVSTVSRMHTVVHVRYRTRTVRQTVTETTSVGGDTGAGADSRCDPNYVGACVPNDGSDYNCPDISETDFESVGSDPDGLDADNDGVACES